MRLLSGTEQSAANRIDSFLGRHLYPSSGHIAAALTPIDEAQ
jgi:hypothetical protein